MEIYDKIRRLRESANMTQLEFAKIAGVSNQAVSAWELGLREPRIKALHKICSYFEIDINKFVDAEYDIYKKPSINNILGRDGTEEISVTRIPILGRISAGLPLYAEQNIEGYTVTDLNHKSEYYALRVKGDSMNAAGINDGDLVVVRRQEVVEDGDIAIVLIDRDDATVKHWHCDGNIVQLMPSSTNPENRIQFYDLKEHEIAVMGKVVRIQKDV